MTDFINIRNLYFSYAKNKVLQDVSIALSQGEIGSLLGSSGCGKSTLLKLIAGFLKPAAGEVQLEKQVISTSRKVLEPEKRQIGLVFQEYSLFPHLTVYENICFGLKKPYPQAHLDKIIAMVGLKDQLQQYPNQISGGQMQRTALARALAPMPKIILFDEAFSSLDTSLRLSLQKEVRDILKTFSICGIFVTHDLEEAYRVSDKIGILYQGKMLQWGSPSQLYQTPADLSVAKFLSPGLEAKVKEGNIVFHNYAIPLEMDIPQNTTLFIRPQDIILDKNSSYETTLVSTCFHGLYQELSLDLGTPFTIQANLGKQYSPGNKIPFTLKQENILQFKA